MRGPTAENVPTIRGNHDRWALEHAGVQRRRSAGAGSDAYEPDAGGTLGSGQELSAEALKWLGRLPTSLVLDLEGVRVAIHHARPGLWGYDTVGIDSRTTSPAMMTTMLESAGADVLLIGHTHARFATRVPGGLVANPGALWSGGGEYGQPGALYLPTGPSYGTFGILDLPSTRFAVYRATDGEVVLESEAENRR